MPPSGQGVILLIKGPPGSGKSTLAMQIALAATQWNLRKDENYNDVCIFSHEQAKRDIKNVLKKRLAWNEKVQSLSVKGKGDCPGREQSKSMNSDMPSLSWARDLVVGLREDNKKYKLLVIDGLNLVISSEQHLLEAEKVISALRDKSKVGILVYEPSDDGSQTVDFHSDIVIEMRGGTIRDNPKRPDYFLQELRIVKSRFQRSVLGWHQYKIRQGGVQVFPSIHYRIHAAVSEDRTRFAVEENFEASKKSLAEHNTQNPKSLKPVHSIIGRLLGDDSFAEGNNVTVVLGPRRAWKTLLTLDWLRQGALKGQNGLLVSLMDDISTTRTQRETLCKYLCPKGKRQPCETLICYEKIFLYYFRPGCIAPCEFFDYMCRRIEGGEKNGPKIDRFLFWDLAQLEYRFPLLAGDPLFLPGMIDYLKHKCGIPSVFMGPANSSFAKMASGIADNVIFCWQDIIELDTKNKSDATNSDCWCFYVDRVAGKAEHGRLHFIQEEDKGKKASKPSQLVKPRSRDMTFLWAESYIEAIQELQGLPVKANSVALGERHLKQ